MSLILKGGLGLWCLMPLSTIFQLYCGNIYSIQKLLGFQYVISIKNMLNPNYGKLL
jgi:hypothetical protein